MSTRRFASSVRRYASNLVLLFLACCLPPTLHAQDEWAAEARATASCREMVARPTDRAATILIFPDSAVTAYCEFGTAPGAYTRSTSEVQCPAGTPQSFLLEGLDAGTRYFYRLRFRPAGAAQFDAAAERSFRTAARRGMPFAFAVEADPHLDANTKPELYRRTLSNILAGGNDFLIDLGDTFMSEKLTTVTPDSVRLRHEYLRGFFDQTCHSVPLYLVIGNHEGELGWLLDGRETSVPVLTARQRTALFANPVADDFYAGNMVSEPFVGLRQNYYAWEWGDALIIVLDPYWYTPVKPGKNVDNWSWTLGRTQYDWLVAQLRNSTARYRFVFSHQLVGGASEGRGGAESSVYYEWGGKNADGSEGFTAKRPGWDAPIHDLLVRYGVQVFFHGHDHFFARQQRDGVVYQLVPQPGNPNYRTAVNAAEWTYVTGDILPCSGYVRVSIGDTNARIDYVRSYLPADENGSRRNGDISFSYTVPPRIPGTGVDAAAAPDVPLLDLPSPHPLRGPATFRYRLSTAGTYQLTLRDVLGRQVATLAEGAAAEGWHDVVWSPGRAGIRMPAGAYIAVLETGRHVQHRTILIGE